jgi:hypothetical protein
VAYDYDEALQQYNVLARNAHAWTEIAIGPNRWQTFDPTPPASLLTLHTSTTTIADQMRWMYQRFEGNWSASVVDFNQSAQSQLADTINRGWAGRLAGFMDAVRASMDRVNRFFSLGPAGYIWMGTVGLAIVIATIALFKLMKRSLAIRRTLRLHHVRGAEYQRMVRQLGFYLDMLRVLDRAGIAKPSWQPPLQFALILGRQNREAADLVREITEAFYDVRYGRQPLDGDSLRAARHMVGQLAASLRVRA